MDKLGFGLIKSFRAEISFVRTNKQTDRQTNKTNKQANQQVPEIYLV